MAWERSYRAIGGSARTVTCGPESDDRSIDPPEPRPAQANAKFCDLECRTGPRDLVCAAHRPSDSPRRPQPQTAEQWEPIAFFTEGVLLNSRRSGPRQPLSSLAQQY